MRTKPMKKQWLKIILVVILALACLNTLQYGIAHITEDKVRENNPLAKLSVEELSTLYQNLPEDDTRNFMLTDTALYCQNEKHPWQITPKDNFYTPNIQYSPATGAIAYMGKRNENSLYDDGELWLQLPGQEPTRLCTEANYYYLSPLSGNVFYVRTWLSWNKNLYASLHLYREGQTILLANNINGWVCRSFAVSSNEEYILYYQYGRKSDNFVLQNISTGETHNISLPASSRSRHPAGVSNDGQLAYFNDLENAYVYNCQDKSTVQLGGPQGDQDDRVLDFTGTQIVLNIDGTQALCTNGYSLFYYDRETGANK